MKKILFGMLSLLLLAGCSASKHVNYMQDVEVGKTFTSQPINPIKVRPGDMLSITVTCKIPELAAMFNPRETNYNVSSGATGLIGSSNSTDRIGVSANNNSQNGVMPYIVDQQGNIDFPVLGPLHVAGMTRPQIADLIRNKIVAGNYIEDPRVNVTFMNLHYSVLGEVANPGKYSIREDKLTLLDALAEAGDLTIHGRRDAVYVTRTVDGQRVTHKVDLRTADLYNSPGYYLQQDDVIYVEPNGTRAGQSTVNENNLKSVSMWVSLASFLMSVAVFFKIKK